MRQFLPKFATVVCSGFFIATTAQAETLPKFTDYPVSIYTGKVAPLDINNSTAKMFKTRIKESLSQPKPDFAGHYSITSWGCGTSCAVSVMTDRKTGKLYGLERIAYKVTEHAPKSCSQIPEAETNMPNEYVTRPNSLLMVEQQYCKADEKGNEIYLNNYLLWHDHNKTFTLLYQAFESKKSHTTE